MILCVFVSVFHICAVCFSRLTSINIYLLTLYRIVLCQCLALFCGIRTPADGVHESSIELRPSIHERVGGNKRPLRWMHCRAGSQRQHERVTAGGRVHRATYSRAGYSARRAVVDSRSLTTLQGPVAAAADDDDDDVIQPRPTDRPHHV